MPGPTINIPLDLSSLTNAKEKIKQLRRELKEANKDIEKAKKDGQEVSAAQKKRFQQAQVNLNQFTSQVRQSQDRVRSFVDSRVQAQRGGNFVDGALSGYGRLVAAKAMIRDATDIANNYSAPRVTDEILGQNSAGRDLRYTYTPSKGYRTAEVVKSAGDTAMAFGIRTGNPYAIAGGAIASGLGRLVTSNEDLAEGQRYRQQQNQLAQRDISSAMEKRLHEQYLKEHEFFGLDAVTERLGLGSLGVSKFKDWNEKHNILGKGAYTKSDLESERSDQDVKLAKLNALKQLRNAAVDLGDFDKAREIMRSAPNVIPDLKVSNPLWKDPATLYTQRESARESSKSWARNNMTRAGPRTGD